MTVERRYDTVVVGAGAAGLAAACAVSTAGFSVALIDREEHLGGILMQCIHTGFGLHTFKRELTGPEYAEEYIDALSKLPVDVYLESTVVEIAHHAQDHTVIAYSGVHGVLELRARTVVLAMGCRERNRGAVGIAGSRPSGIFTAGLAQRLLNIDGLLPGREAVIVGSGDIGLIMARRMSWVGCRVRCVVEILPYPSGLTRNIVQCLQDNAIPLHLSHAVIRINGRDRVESVDIAPLENGVPVESAAFNMPCDTVLLSVGLIPENELSRRSGVEISPDTGGPVVNHRLETNVAGVFACGNVLHVHDLVDWVSQEAGRCAAGVAAYLGGSHAQQGLSIRAGANLKYVVPGACAAGSEIVILTRPLVVRDRGELRVTQGETLVRAKAFSHVCPAQMLSMTLSAEQTLALDPRRSLEVSLEI